MAVAEVAPKARPLTRPSPGNCSAVAIAPTALTAPAKAARTIAPNSAPDGVPPDIRANRQIGKMALHPQRTARTVLRPRRSDKAPVTGVTRITAIAAMVDS